MNKNASKEQYLQQKLEELKTICQEKGMRLTQQRIEIYKEVANMIFRVDNQLPKARFDADKTPHHHFLCVQCNEVYDIFLEDSEKINIPKNALKFGEIKDLNLQIRGICNKCLKGKNNK